jgi:hypothetical protein
MREGRWIREKGEEKRVLCEMYSTFVVLSATYCMFVLTSLAKAITLSPSTMALFVRLWDASISLACGDRDEGEREEGGG